MGVNIPDAVKETLLDDIADNGDILHICSGEPANYAGIAAVSLGSVALTEGDGNGDYTIGDGDTSGRKLSLSQQSITPTDTDDATHLAIADSVAEELLAVNTCSTYSVTTGVAVIVSAYDIVEVRDATT